MTSIGLLLPLHMTTATYISSTATPLSSNPNISLIWSIPTQWKWRGPSSKGLCRSAGVYNIFSAYTPIYFHGFILGLFGHILCMRYLSSLMTYYQGLCFMKSTLVGMPMQRKEIRRRRRRDYSANAESFMPWRTTDSQSG